MRRYVYTKHPTCSSFPVCAPASTQNSRRRVCRTTYVVSAGERQERVLGDLESQFITGLRRKDGRTVGLGL